MRKCLGLEWKNHNFWDKTVLKNLFSLDFSLHDRWLHQTKNSIQIEFSGKRGFYVSLKICSFCKLTPDFENRYKHHFKTTAGSMKGQSMYSHIL